ncbi:Fic family protein [Tenacibaculum tangerinum]|uniref:Fic family protein n=1 Tax=Tenacibaculum tangerinum TaxID=3038772 RepID=A0ABY8L5C7_9FLAO|nr:Fic family protein [Tenacibaculum tangerinum]WGH75388.1 Fic family protein [Tenacibaculum tangerinum]
MDLAKIEEGKKQFETTPVSAKLLSSLRKSARLVATHYSTQIEGNRLTMEEVTQVVDKNIGGLPGRERDEKEVRNYYLALEYVDANYTKILTEKILQTIHGLVLYGKKKPTLYRDGQNVIKDGFSNAIVYMPPEASDVSMMMQDLIVWINDKLQEEKIPVPIIAALAHYQFATIHPYYDGNGRTARLLTNYILHHGGYGLKGIYSLEEYYAKHIHGYYDALAVEDIPNYYMGREQADLTDFLEYFTKGMAIAFTNIIENSKKQNPVISNDNSKLLRELSAKQRMSLGLFLQQKEITTNDLAIHLGVSKRSAAILIKKWLGSDFLIIGNSSKKARTYLLHHKWEKLI